MSKLVPLTRNFSAVVAIIFAAIGGIYFGLFSCGGYAWHFKLFVLLLALITLLAVLFPGAFLRSWQRRIIFPLAVIFTYVLLQAVTAPFYPSSPSDIAKYVESFVHTLEFGPC
jgi:hypothetical protein